MRFYLKTKDFSVSGEEFELFLDEDLDMLVTRPQPHQPEKYYQSEDYISHTDSKRNFVDKIYQWVKRYSLKRKTTLIDSFVKGSKTLLDIGCGTGDFLVAAKKRNWSVLGVEPNKGARTLAANKGVDVKENLESLAQTKFDIITLWHVLEHLPRLEAQIDVMVSLLKDGGTLIIAVPNYKSFDAVHYKKFWAAYDVPRHLWHFSRKSIEHIFSKKGMKVVKIKPMIFDSYYVALLSEKNKFGSNRFLSAFYIGIRSNIRAWTSKEYSSLIYILKKH